MSEYNINSQYTFLERAKAITGASGRMAREILDVMDKQGVESFMKEFPVFPCSHGLKHRVRRTVSRPTATHRNLYAGVGPTIVTTQIIWEPVVQFAERYAPDEDEFAGMDDAAARSENQIQIDGHIKSLQEAYVNAIFNESRATGSEYVDGLGARLNRLSYPGHSTETLPYVWNGGGTGSDLCSMYLAEFGPRSVFGLIPALSTKEGKTLGVIVDKVGREARPDSDDSTKTWYALVTNFKLWAGVACADDRKFTRLANFEKDAGAAKSFNENLLIDALAHGRFDTRATRAFVGPTLYAQFCKKAKDKSNQTLNWVDIFGKPVLTIWGIPIRMLDSTILGVAESAVT